MKHYYPNYYQAFRCIAADCPDSCCQGWDVVIDSETEACYHTVQGEFGERLRSAICTDSDGDRVFRLAEEKKCPFWGEDKLCDIYTELGENHLCATCAMFPRITMDYTVFCEHTLALACPEAARLILAADNAYDGFCGIEATDCEDYSADVMRLLLDSRRTAAEILLSDKPLPHRFEKLLSRARLTQKALTGADGDPAAVSLAALCEKMEYIDEKNRARFARAAACSPDFSRHGKALTNLALYWLYRYQLSAIDSLDVIAPTRFLIASVGTTAALANESGDIVAAAQLYSKETEQSYENMELMWEALGSIG